jgi:hypothetical protein
MSGGKEKKSRSSKTQGWEEAGGEFYQESYPGDMDNLNRDPSKLATLLPSKQRVGKYTIYFKFSFISSAYLLGSFYSTPPIHHILLEVYFIPGLA